MLCRILCSLFLTCSVAVIAREILDGSAVAAPAPAPAAATPVNRAVSLLKEMSKTLQKDMDEDEEQYDKLACWCQENSKAKATAIKENTAKRGELKASIDELTATSAALKVKITELKGSLVDNQNTLAKATALRKQELAEFNKNEVDSTANIANLKGAITVLSKHHSAALPQIDEAFSFLSVKSRVKSDEPWGLETKDQRDLDLFMGSNGFMGLDDADVAPAHPSRLRRPSPVGEASRQEWSFDEVSAIQRAIKSATFFAQKRGQDTSDYVPKYSAQSGEIFGMLRQLKEEMEKDLSEAQKTESSRASDFAELRTAKTAEISGGEKSIDQKEEEKSKAGTDLQEAKEDLEQTEATLAQDEKFAENLKITCDEADKNYAERKQARESEMQAVSQTIEILTADDAKNAMSGTFNKPKSFLQLSKSHSSERALRRRAARVLRRTAAHTGNAALALLANTAELDAFTAVKAAIDKMVGTLQVQQSDEVKKNDYCTKELQSNEMATMKGEDLKSDLEASVKERDVAVKKFEEEIEAAKSSIKKEQVSLQKATENRKKENLDFQKTQSDQILTVAVLKKAMERLAAYYDEAELIQTHHSRHLQKGPPQQMKYEANGAAGGVMSLIEKLIYDAKRIMKDSQKAEADAQKAYEEMVEDSNGMIKALTKQVTSKTDAKVEAKKDHTQKSMDLKQTNKDLEKLGKLEKNLHEECDYVMKNFMIRQQARSEEIESLQQAKSVLSGAQI